MDQQRKSILQLIVLMIVLVVLATTLVGVVGVGVFLSSAGLQPAAPQPSSSETSPAILVQVPKALMDPVGMWTPPDWGSVERESNAEEIKYGKELLANTAEYLGPQGKVRRISNGLNCQNCHLDAGRVPLGNNYGAVAATYPKVRNRSGQLEDIPKRINDCFERSLNGDKLDPESKEMKAMVAYMLWLGKEVPKGQKPKGAGLYEVPLLDRPADPIKGKLVYDQHCVSCHMEDGQGLAKMDGSGYVYPPLWGEHSYNQGAGLYRLSRFAGYVKANMPFGITYENPILTDEEAWDVAAYVNSLDRPTKNLAGDWPDISKKPMDHPFGPYADEFSEEQHKYGPFQAIQKAKESQ
ncbi:c-type cytochrome [Algoriphagus namhaensis]